jgi:creatinine amidohydrolase
MQLELVNWQQVEKYLNNDDRIIIPLGSTEQHGPFGLFGTDHLIPWKAALEAGKRQSVLVAPALPVGMSIHHLKFPGTMTLRPTTFIAVLEDILESFNCHGFKKILLLNGHGGNRATIESALSEITYDLHEIKVRFKNWWDYPRVDKYIKKEFGDREGHHSTPSENSIMMYLYQNSFENKKVEYHSFVRSKTFPSPQRFRELYPDGVMGADTNLSSTEHGEKLFHILVDEICTELLEMKEVD